MKKRLLSLALIISGGINLMYAQAPLFFSEYAEGSSQNKYLEIFNPSDSVVSLDAYAFPNSNNGADSMGLHDYWNTFTEGATISPGDVYVIADSDADSLILVYADQTHESLSNGDDGFALVYGTESDYQILDFIGDFNGDPGSGWAVAGVSNGTKDHTLVRKFSVSQGNSDWTLSAGTNTEDSEWIVFDQNEWSYLGSHSELVVAAGCTDPMAINYCEECTQNDGTCMYPELNLTIAEIQGMLDVSPYVGQMVTTTGLVVAISESTYFLQSEVGAWNGIYVYSANDSLVVGNQISITAFVGEYSGATQLSDVNSVTILSSEFTNLPTSISAEMLNTEAYEGVLVTVDILECIAETNNYGEAEFSGTTDTIISDDMFLDFTPILGAYYSLTGVVNHSYGNYKINPRWESDIVEYIVGCMDASMSNYNPVATLELDDSCQDIEIISGCIDPEALNYCAECNDDDGSCIYPSLVLTIAEIQGMTVNSPYEGQIVSTSGTVTAVNSIGYFIQDAVAAWSGIFVYDSVNVVIMGDVIALEAEVAEFYDMTQLKNIIFFTVTTNSTGEYYSTLTMDYEEPLAEKYEGCLVEYNGMDCIQSTNEFGEAIISSGSDVEVITSDFIFLYPFEAVPSPSGITVIGVVEYSFGEYKICPRNSDDVHGEISVPEFDASNTSIKMLSNVLQIESTIVGKQEFKIYNILGESVLEGVFDTQLALPLHYLQTATYIVKVGTYSQMVFVP